MRIHKSVKLSKGMFVKKEFTYAKKPVKLIFQINNIADVFVKGRKARQGYNITGLLYYSDNPKHTRYLFNDTDDTPMFHTRIMFEEIKKGDAKYFIMDDGEAVLYRL